MKLSKWQERIGLLRKLRKLSRRLNKELFNLITGAFCPFFIRDKPISLKDKYQTEWQSTCLRPVAFHRSSFPSSRSTSSHLICSPATVIHQPRHPTQERLIPFHSINHTCFSLPTRNRKCGITQSPKSENLF